MNRFPTLTSYRRFLLFVTFVMLIGGYALAINLSNPLQGNDPYSSYSSSSQSSPVSYLWAMLLMSNRNFGSSGNSGAFLVDYVKARTIVFSVVYLFTALFAFSFLFLAEIIKVSLNIEDHLFNIRNADKATSDVRRSKRLKEETKRAQEETKQMAAATMGAVLGGLQAGVKRVKDEVDKQAQAKASKPIVSEAPQLNDVNNGQFSVDDEFSVDDLDIDDFSIDDLEDDVPAAAPTWQMNVKTEPQNPLHAELDQLFKQGKQDAIKNRLLPLIRNGQPEQAADALRPFAKQYPFAFDLLAQIEQRYPAVKLQKA